MARYAYERLSAQDNSFLLFETEKQPMHIAAVLILEAGNLRTPAGGINIERYKQATAAVLHRIPRYRQKLRTIPFFDHPVWIDDPHFNLDYHVRHSALPRPGDIGQLKKLTARILTRPLDRSHPLWEIWVIEGLEDDRFAVVSKIHHCMLDGMAGVGVAQILLSPSAEDEPGEAQSFYPRPAPHSLELVRHEALRWAGLPLRAFGALREFAKNTEDLAEELTTRASALGALAESALTNASDTPINGNVGPHRSVDWVGMPLEAIKKVRRQLNCTVNDVVLATVAGAMREYMLRRTVDPNKIDFRVSAPVSVRGDHDNDLFGNRVSSWIVPLPLNEADPLARVAAINRTTSELKESQQAVGVEMMMRAAEVAPPRLLGMSSRAASQAINMIVTNVPGPQFPLFTLGARLVDAIPFVPLLETTGLGLALFSYDGKLFWGLNADAELIPDLPTLSGLLVESFEALATAAGAAGDASSDLSEVPRSTAA